MKKLAIILIFFGTIFQANAEPTSHSMPHEMQHGFVLSTDDKFGSHLVATGHHSRQAEIMGHLLIWDPAENENYTIRKSMNAHGGTYFLFQAQSLDLPSLKVGQVLTGHIVGSQVGKYEPENIIVKRATFTIDRIILNIENPFFGDQ